MLEQLRYLFNYLLFCLENKPFREIVKKKFKYFEIYYFLNSFFISSSVANSAAILPSEFF